MPQKDAAKEPQQPEQLERERYNVTPDKFISAVIGRVWLVSLELRNLDYETFHSGKQPQHVSATAVVQRTEAPHEEEEFDGSGRSIGEALRMVLDQVEAWA